MTWWSGRASLDQKSWVRILLNVNMITYENEGIRGHLKSSYSLSTMKIWATKAWPCTTAGLGTVPRTGDGWSTWSKRTERSPERWPSSSRRLEGLSSSPSRSILLPEQNRFFFFRTGDRFERKLLTFSFVCWSLLIFFLLLTEKVKKKKKKLFGRSSSSGGSRENLHNQCDPNTSHQKCPTIQKLAEASFYTQGWSHSIVVGSYSDLLISRD